jgi:hypothetical protein
MIAYENKLMDIRTIKLIIEVIRKNNNIKENIIVLK